MKYYLKLIRLVERETGMKFKVKPKVYPNYKPKFSKGWNCCKWVMDDRGNIKYTKATVYVSGYKTKKLREKYPKLRILIHELVENLWIQNHIRTEKDANKSENFKRAHNYAKLWEKRIMKKFMESK